MTQNWTSIVESNWIFSKLYIYIYIYIYFKQYNVHESNFYKFINGKESLYLIKSNKVFSTIILLQILP